MPVCNSHPEKENLMFSKDLELGIQVAAVKATEKRQDSQVSARAYRTPELHDVGKAADLVQGGGGGNYLDANRSRYY
jgi:hypothetical protein